MSAKKISFMKGGEIKRYKPTKETELFKRLRNRKGEDVMMKKIVITGLAVSLLVCNAFISQAVICSKSPDGVHHFNAHRAASAGYSVDRGTHEYLYGYDQNNNPIYRTDCKISDKYEYCEYICSYCGVANTDQGSHSHFIKTWHSINHK